MNRVVGGLSILGVAFIGLALLLLGTNAGGWQVPLILEAIGIGLLFVSRHYYFRLPVVVPDQREKHTAPQPFAPFVAAHRRELRVLAQIGLGLSLVRLVGLFFGSNWPGIWGVWLLGGGSFALVCIAPMWPRPLPKWVGWILRMYSTGLLAFVSVAATDYWNHRQWPATEHAMKVIFTLFFVLFYGGAVVRFARGQIPPVSVDPAG